MPTPATLANRLKSLKIPGLKNKTSPDASQISDSSEKPHWILRYGDLTYDFASSLLWSTRNGKLILKRLYLSHPGRELNSWSGAKLERAAVFRELLQLIRDSHWRYMRRLTTAEQRMLDGNLVEDGRLRQFDSYVHRLSFDDLALLLIRDKFGFPISEAAAIFEAPEASLQLQRQHAFEALCDWIWDSSDTRETPECFQVQKKSTASLDGKLQPGEASAIEKHLGGCPACTENYRRIRKLLTCASDMPRFFLPADQRGHRIAQEKLFSDFRTRSLSFSEIPWFLRTGAESLVITFGILLAVALIPRFQRLYEASVNQRLDTLIASSTDESPLDSVAPASKQIHIEPQNETAANFGEEDSIHSGEDLPPLAAEGDSDLDESAVQTDEPKQPGAGPSEVWRFSLRTSSPKEARSKVIAKLMALGGTPENTPGLGGVEAPGGIQFNLVVDRAWLPDIRKHLNSLTSDQQNDGRNTARTQNPLSTTEPLRWYRSASKTSLPTGKTRIIIWLSQI